MNPASHFSDEELIEFRMQDSAREQEFRAHIEACVVCAERSEELAQLLRLFSGEPVPRADPDRGWNSLRGHLKPLGARRSRQHLLPAWGWASVACGLVAMALAIGVVRHGRVTPIANEANLRHMDPLRATPDGAADQLASAERLLTAVNHASGPLDEMTRSQAHALLLRNATYIGHARAQGELGEAATLMSLGRVLTDIEAAATAPNSGQQLRLDWNIAGLLFEVRVLQQDTSNAHPLPAEETQ